MKAVSLFLSLFFVINFTLLNAQTEQGKILVGVSSTLSLAGTGSDIMTLGYSNTKYKSDADGFEESDPDKTVSINLLPKVGYFVVDNLAFGLDINLSLSNKTDGENNGKFTQKLFSAGPFLRYYIPMGKVLPFYEVNGSFGSVKSTYEPAIGETNDDKSSIMSFGAGLGLAVPIGEKVTFDILAGYNSMTIKNKEDNADNDRVVLGTIGLRFGFIILLGSN